MEETFWIQSEADGTPIFTKKFFSDKKPKALVQIAHGMAEHIQRYDEFAQFLVEQGIFVYGNDHRGHGESGLKQGLLGYFSERDGFLKAAKDLYQITKQMKNDYPDTPIFLFGHSMGSFLARCYMQQHSEEIDGVILSGTGYFPYHLTAFGKQIALRLEQKKASPLMNKLAFGGYNRKISYPKTAFDWLSRDDREVQKYVEDPLSGYIPTARFFVDLFTGIEQMQNKNANRSVHKDLPLLFISGDHDPVGNYGRGVWKSAELYESLGFRHITVLLYEKARHELLHEINRKEVFSSILKWMEQHL